MNTPNWFTTTLCLSLGFMGCGGKTDTPDESDTPDEQVEVIVIGAGFAGLVAAERLVEGGVNVTLLEREDRVGGKLVSVPLGGTQANMGAQYIFYGSNPTMNEYVERVPKFFAEGAAGVQWDGELHTELVDLPLSGTAWMDLSIADARIAADHDAIAQDREFFFDAAPTSERWEQLDAQSAADYLSDLEPDVMRLYDMMLSPEGGGGTETTTALLLVGWYAETGDSLSGDQFLVEGGNQGIAELVHQDFTAAGGETHLSTEVQAVTDTGGGVVVRTISGDEFEADYVVVATPAHVARAIVPSLDAPKADALDAVQYGRMGQVALHLVCHPTGERLAGMYVSDGDFSGYIDQTDTPAEDTQAETVISVVLAGDQANLDLSDDALVQYVAEALQAIDPDFDPKACIAGSAVQRWHYGIPSFLPGLLSQHQEALRAAHGRVHFAGDYTHDPSLDGAAWSGVRASDQILSRIQPNR